MPAVITKAIVADALKRHRDGLSFEMTDLRTKGLELRCRPKGVVWSFRWQTGKKSNRLALGPAEVILLEEARWMAQQAVTALRVGVVLDVGWIAARYVDLGKVHPADVLEGQSVAAGQWTVAEARAEYLEYVQRTKSSTTYDDYKTVLKGRDLNFLDLQQVSTITRQHIAEILADVHRSGRETHADHIARVVRPFWTWLGQDAQIGKSGVAPECMDTLRAPERSRVDDDDDEDEHGTYVPSLEEMGRAIALARSPAISTPIGCAIELLIWTVQRRRAIVEARIQDFIPISETEGLWRVPPASRKGRKRNGKRKRPLVVPLPAPVWSCVQRAMKARTDKGSEFLFPAKGRSGHMHTSTLSHMIGFLPGVIASGHDMRRGFGTHGEAILGLLRADTKSILDHEDDSISVREITHRTATGATDMTGVHYSLHDGSHRTWPIMRAWVGALEPHVDDSLADEQVQDKKWVAGQIARARRRTRSDVALQVAAE